MGILHINKTLYGSLPNSFLEILRFRYGGQHIPAGLPSPPPSPQKKPQKTKNLLRLKLHSSATLVKMMRIS